MSEPKFKMFDKVWYAELSSVQRWATCPDCCGQRYLTVIMGDKTEVTIKCDNCGPGYNDSRGAVSYYEYVSEPQQVVIESVSCRDGKTEYGFRGRYSAREEHFFATEQEAVDGAKAIVAEYNQRQLDSIKRKEKEHKSWSFNATYHRNCIRRAEKEIERHKECLDYASKMAKEVKL